MIEYGSAGGSEIGLVWVLAAALLSACGGLRVQPDRYYVVDGRQALAISSAAEVIVDLRPPDDFERGHIPGAVSIPLNQLWFRMDELPWRPEALILAYDDEPGRQARAGGRLKTEGYFNVHFIENGFAGWRAGGGDVSTAPAPPRADRGDAGW
jgi:rhodanese-related sulfurtransferase